MSFSFLTRLTSVAQEVAASTKRRWRTLASLALILAGLGCISWGGYELVVMAAVPHCVYSTKEQQQQDIQEGQNALATSDQALGDELSLSSNVQIGMVQVEVFGAVVQPGVYYLQSDARIIDAINIAGGLTDQADQELLHQHLNMAQKITDEQKISVPLVQEQELADKMALYCQNQAEIERQTRQSESPSQEEISWLEEVTSTNANDNKTENTSDSSNECVSLNNASSDQLQTLSGVGVKTAELIIAGRPYLKIEDLTNVKGIGAATLEKLEPYICL